MKHEARSTKFETNSKFKIQNPKQFPFRYFGFQALNFVSDFGFRISDLRHMPRGVTLLLVILVLSAVLSISLGIFEVVFTELRLSGEIADSFTALYAADEAIERGLYEDRDVTPFCLPAPGPGENCYDSGLVPLSNGACSRLRVSKIVVAPGVTDVTLRANGEFRCGSELLGVKRALSITYRVEE